MTMRPWTPAEKAEWEEEVASAREHLPELSGGLRALITEDGEDAGLAGLLQTFMETGKPISYYRFLLCVALRQIAELEDQLIEARQGQPGKKA